MTKDKALKLARYALFLAGDYDIDEAKQYDEAITAIEQALAQRPWVGLTDEEVNWFGWHGTDIRAVEAKLKELNT